jgi:hypothetical protein
MNKKAAGSGATIVYHWEEDGEKKSWHAKAKKKSSANCGSG